MKYGVVALLLVTSFIGAMEYNPDIPEQEAQQEGQDGTDRAYETFRNMWRAYAIIRKAIACAKPTKQYLGDWGVGGGQRSRPGVQSSKSQTKKGLFMAEGRAYPEDLLTPWGAFEVADERNASSQASVEKVLELIEERMEIEPYIHPDFRSKKWKIVSIDGKKLEAPEFREVEDRGYSPNAPVIKAYCSMMRKFRKEDEFQEQIKPLLLYEGVLENQTASLEFFQDNPFFHALWDPIA